MDDPLFDRDLDNVPPPPVRRRSPASPAGTSYRATPKKAAKPPPGPHLGPVAGWFQGLSTPGLFIWAVGIGALATLPVVLALRPETRQPWPFYLVSVAVAVVGTIKARLWLDRGDVDADGEPELDAWDYAVLSGEKLFDFSVGVLFARGLLYCPPQGNAILPRGDYSGEDDRERAVFHCFPWAGWKSMNPHPAAAPLLRTSQQEIHRRLVDLGLTNPEERIATYQRILYWLWTLPLILIVFSLFVLLEQTPKGQHVKPPDLAFPTLVLCVVHIIVWFHRVSPTNPDMEAKRGRFPTRSGRRALKRARSILGTPLPGKFSSLAPPRPP